MFVMRRRQAALARRVDAGRRALEHRPHRRGGEGSERRSAFRRSRSFPFTDPKKRSEDAREAFNADNLVCRATRAIKDAKLDLGVILDVALDPYTSHGHDGLLVGDEIANDETNAALVKQALVQAEAGADVLAPSDMMDGRIGVIRARARSARAIRTRRSCPTPPSMRAPSTDRSATRSALTGFLKGDKRTYQMDPANTDEALREVALDLAEGADMVMVKPGLPYLDIVRRVSETFDVPTFAYQVSGEYAMIAAAVEKGWLDARQGDARKSARVQARRCLRASSPTSRRKPRACLRRVVRAASRLTRAAQLLRAGLRRLPWRQLAARRPSHRPAGRGRLAGTRRLLGGRPLRLFALDSAKRRKSDARDRRCRDFRQTSSP